MVRPKISPMDWDKAAWGVIFPSESYAASVLRVTAVVMPPKNTEYEISFSQWLLTSALNPEYPSEPVPGMASKFRLLPSGKMRRLNPIMILV